MCRLEYSRDLYTFLSKSLQNCVLFLKGEVSARLPFLFQGKCRKNFPPFQFARFVNYKVLIYFKVEKCINFDHLTNFVDI